MRRTGLSSRNPSPLLLGLNMIASYSAIMSGSSSLQFKSGQPRPDNILTAVLTAGI